MGNQNYKTHTNNHKRYLLSYRMSLFCGGHGRNLVAVAVRAPISDNKIIFV